MSELSQLVEHNTAQQQFILTVEGLQAVLAYRMRDASTLDFYRTYVPDELRGRSIAAILVERGLQFAQEKGWQVVPSCSYVQVYMERQRRKAGA